MKIADRSYYSLSLLLDYIDRLEKVLAKAIVYSLFFICAINLLSDAHNHDKKRESGISKMVYGPTYLQNLPKKGPALKNGLSKIVLKRNWFLSGQLTKEQFIEVFSDSLPLMAKKHFVELVPTMLKFAEKFNVDPFWITSVIWTESHFNPSAISYVSAQGLMQIMPSTGVYLLKKKGRHFSTKQAIKLIRDPKINLELGIGYLRELLNFFNGNRMLATVAYNMGPYWVKRRLRKNLPVGVKNLYLDKVNRAYKNMGRLFNQRLMSHIPAYYTTYLNKNYHQRPKYQGHFLSKLITIDSLHKKRRTNYVMRFSEVSLVSL